MAEKSWWKGKGNQGAPCHQWHGELRLKGKLPISSYRLSLYNKVAGDGAEKQRDHLLVLVNSIFLSFCIGVWPVRLCYRGITFLRKNLGSGSASGIFKCPCLLLEWSFNKYKVYSVLIPFPKTCFKWSPALPCSSLGGMTYLPAWTDVVTR